MYERLQEIETLKKEIEAKKDRLLRLIGLLEEKPKADKTPEGFELGGAILAILKENNEPMKARALVKEVQARHNFRPDTRVVRSSLTYLKEKGEVEKAGKGLFKAK